MQNLPNDLNPAKQTLEERLKQLQISRRISSQSKSTETYSVKTPSLGPSQNVMNTSIDAEPLSAQTSEQITIVQVVSPLTEAEGNDKTIVQNLNPQDSTPSAVLVDDVSLPQKPKVVQQIGSSSQPTQTVEAIDRTQNTIAQFSLEDDSKNLNAAEVTVVQNHNNTIISHSDSVARNLTERTSIQYSDSAIHNPAQQTVCQAMPPLSTNRTQTLIQSRMPKSSHSSTLATVPKNRGHIPLSYSGIRYTFCTLGSFPSRITSTVRGFFYSMRNIDLRELQSLFHRGRQPAMGKISERSSSTPLNYSTYNAIASDEQPSSEEYQKKLRELDLCRLCFAKELARNGKFRSAISEAEQISETSYFFKDAQVLIRSWK